MAAAQEQTNNEKAAADIHKIDPKAPIGSKNALGAESIRDGRPSTGDEVVEAMDEEGPDA